MKDLKVVACIGKLESLFIAALYASRAWSKSKLCARYERIARQSTLATNAPAFLTLRAFSWASTKN